MGGIRPLMPAYIWSISRKDMKGGPEAPVESGGEPGRRNERTSRERNERTKIGGARNERQKVESVGRSIGCTSQRCKHQRIAVLGLVPHEWGNRRMATSGIVMWRGARSCRSEKCGNGPMGGEKRETKGAATRWRSRLGRYGVTDVVVEWSIKKRLHVAKCSGQTRKYGDTHVLYPRFECWV
jgi:hypothetical protein